MQEGRDMQLVPEVCKLIQSVLQHKSRVLQYRIPAFFYFNIKQSYREAARS